VMVPVLSKTIVSTFRKVDVIILSVLKNYLYTFWAFSKISAPLIKIPFWAPTPVLTMTAVGVASPKAQGQAIAKTLSAHWKAY